MFKHARNVTRIGVVALAGLGLGLAGGCAEDTEAASTPSSSQKLAITVVNRAGDPLDGVGMKAGKWNISWGDISAGGSETVSLPEGERPQTMYFTWRDAKGERHYQNLTLPGDGVHSATITINGQRATASFR